MADDGYDSMDAEAERELRDRRRRLLMARLSLVRKMHFSDGIGSGYCVDCSLVIAPGELKVPFPCPTMIEAEADIRNDYAGLPMAPDRLQAIQALLDAPQTGAPVTKEHVAELFDVPSALLNVPKLTFPGIRAAGGWCAPSTQMWDMDRPLTPEEHRDVLLAAAKRAEVQRQAQKAELKKARKRIAKLERALLDRVVPND